MLDYVVEVRAFEAHRQQFCTHYLLVHLDYQEAFNARSCGSAGHSLVAAAVFQVLQALVKRFQAHFTSQAGSARKINTKLNWFEVNRRQASTIARTR